MPIIYLLLLAYSLLPVTAVAETDLLSFADSLAAEEDHYRAITEYKRFLHYYPQDARAAYAQLEIGKNLLAGKRWDPADRALEKVWEQYPGSTEALLAKRLHADAAYERGDYTGAEKRYRELKDEQGANKLPALDYALSLCALQQNQTKTARDNFARLEPALSQQLSLSLDQYEQLPQKSPRLAGTLSAILPGAGQLYTERPRQASIAFALNAAFIYGAIEAWNNENYAVTGILSLFELGWYGGNIYNAVNNAHKYNRRQKQQFLENLQQRLSLSLGWQQSRPELRAQFNF